MNDTTCERWGSDFELDLGGATIDLERVRDDEHMPEEYTFGLCRGCADELDRFLDKGEISR